MKRNLELLAIAAVLLALSTLLYLAHYLLFHDLHHIFLYLVGDLAFLPLEVFLVVVVIERVLSSREKHSLLNKLNMLVGAFYSEVGTHLLGRLVGLFPGAVEIRGHLAVKADWSTKDFEGARSFTRQFKGAAVLNEVTLEELRAFLVQKRSFLLGLLENPNLMEHENFTDLLWALFHLTEELEARPSFKGLAASDLAHLAGDLDRAFGRLASEWLSYARHLKAQYPYLFSLLLRTHPFQDHPSPTVR